MTLDPRAVARALGGEVVGRNVLAPGPGHSSSDRSLSVKVAPAATEGFHVHSFCGDHWTNCRDYVRAAIGLPAWTPTRELPRVATAASRQALVNPTDPEPSAFAREIWRQTDDLRGTVGERYLKRRRLELDPDLAQVLRFHPRCPFGKGETVLALVAAFHPFDVSRDKAPTAIHRIGLTPTGEKIGKKFIGPVAGCAIKFDADDANTLGLGVSEGPETGIAVRASGWRPMWSLGSAGGMKNFPVLSGIEVLTIFADCDMNHVGQVAARTCAKRWSAAGVHAVVRTPRMPGTDWLDALT